MLITKAALSRRKPVVALMLVMIIVGVFSYITLPREDRPDISIPNIMVMTSYSGVAPEDIETLITLPIERKLKGIKDVDEITSVSAEGSSMINVEFVPDVDIDEALQRVRDRVDQAKGDLPADLENDPQVMEINLSEFPIMQVAVSANISEPALKEVAETIEEHIEELPGVLEVDLVGARDREIRVEFDPQKMIGYNLSFADIWRLVSNENVNIPGGTIDIGEAKYLVRIPGEFDNIDDLDNLVVTVRDGRPIYLKEVARIVDTFEDEKTRARLNGHSSLTLSVKKRTGENIVEVCDQVFAILAEAEKQLPDTIEFSVTLNQSKDIRRMVHELENNIVSGIVLVVAVLFMFLGFRNALLVGIAIPISMLISFTVLSALGVTLNMVVLFSLILALGMLVDNAVVIVENIYRHIGLGKRRLEAARDATKEVGWPVISSTVTTLCAFMPLMFWPGLIGEFMQFLPLTLIIVLSSSLFVALVFNPVLSSILMTGVKDRKRPGPSVFIQKYEQLLETLLNHRIKTVLGFIVLLIVMAGAYGKFGNGVEMFPDVEPNFASVNIEAAEGTSLDTTDALAAEIEQFSRQFEDIEYTIAESGVGGGHMLSGSSAGQSHLAKVTMNFVDAEDRTQNTESIIQQVRNFVATLPGATFEVTKMEKGPPTGAPVSIEVVGDNIDELQGIVTTIKQLIVDTEGLVDLKDDLSRAKPEIRLDVDRNKAILNGLSTSLVSNTVKAAVSGYKLGVYREGQDEYDIYARLPQVDRKNYDDIGRLQIPANNGSMVPLSSVATMTTGYGFGSINHINQKRVATITANTEGRNSNEVLKEVQSRLSDLELKPGYTIRYSGEQEEQQKASAFLIKAFLAAVFAISLVLLVQFNSFFQSFMVMTSVVLSMGGVFFGLLVTGMPFGIIMTGIGVISLAGIVVNNAIVLIDYTNQLCAEGMPVRKAVVQAGKVRLRPVLLTAITTILGLLPMATGVSFDFIRFAWDVGGESAQWWGPMAVAVIFGLTLSTALTLILTPVLYSFIKDKG